jgi:hypothetical protein
MRMLRLPIINSISWFFVDSCIAVSWKRKSHRIHDSNAQTPHGWCQLTRG